MVIQLPVQSNIINFPPCNYFQIILERHGILKEPSFEVLALSAAGVVCKEKKRDKCFEV